MRSRRTQHARRRSISSSAASVSSGSGRSASSQSRSGSSCTVMARHGPSWPVMARIMAMTHGSGSAFLSVIFGTIYLSLPFQKLSFDQMQQTALDRALLFSSSVQECHARTALVIMVNETRPSLSGPSASPSRSPSPSAPSEGEIEHERGPGKTASKRKTRCSPSRSRSESQSDAGSSGSSVVSG